MKSKLKFISTLFFVFIFFLFGCFIYSNLKIEKTSKVISYNDSLFDATDATLAALYIYKGESTLLHEMSGSDFGSLTTFSFDVDWDVYEVKLLVAANDPFAKATGGGKYTLKSGVNNIPITVTPKGGTSVVYTVQINRQNMPSGTHSALLYSFTIDKMPEYILDPTKTTFTYTIPSGWYYIGITGKEYDTGNVTITYEGFEYVPQSKTCYIKTKNTITNEEVTYTINLVKKLITSSDDYNYSGNTKTFTAPYTGYYKLEAWGAQGGSDGARGGYGGYSMGVIELLVGNKIYVTVGGRGDDCRSGAGGGFNGGGDAGNYGCSGAGGGATHFAYTTGDLKSFKTTMSAYDTDIDTARSSELIMVAGGGGGSGWYSAGGSGGGFKGTKGEHENGGTPGMQNSYGAGISPGAFGQGGNRTGGDGGGGGAGLYGGGAGYSDVGGGGGSGYIGNINLISTYRYTKHMTCYQCTEALETSTVSNSEIRTYSTNSSSNNATADVAKRGNGYAQVTYLDLSENKYLADIQVIQPTTQNVIPFKDDVEFEYNQPLYEVELPSNQTKIQIKVRTIDDRLTITGDTGEQRVPGGTHDFIITCTSELGVVYHYTIRTYRPPSTTISVDAIEIHGLIDHYCQLDFDANLDFNYDDLDKIDFCELYAPGALSSDTPAKVEWDRNQKEYDLHVPARIKELRFEVISDNDNQVITGVGSEKTLVPGTNLLTIDVVSEACALEYNLAGGGVVPDEKKDVCTLGYTYTVYRDYYHDADLSELYIATNEIEPTEWEYGRHFDLNFTDPGVLNYYFSVPYTWDHVKHLYYKADILHSNYTGLEILDFFEDANVEIYGNEDFEIGKTNIVEIVVHAPDSISTTDPYTGEVTWEGTQQTYYLHVYREYSDNSLLKSLRYLNKDVIEVPISPGFNPVRFDYEVTVPTNNDVGYLKFEPQESSTTIKVWSRRTNEYLEKSVSSLFVYFVELPLKRGDNYFDIQMVAQDGEAMSTYTVTVHRTLSNDSRVTDIKAHTGEKYWDLVPGFDPDTTSYDIYVDKGTEYVDFDVTTVDEAANVTVVEGRYIASAGDIEKTIVITSEDGRSTREYHFVIHREPFDIAALQYLNVTSLAGTDNGTVYTLTPPFDSATFDYTLVVPNLTTNVRVDYAPTNKFARVNVDFSQNEFFGVTLHEGANKLRFEVVAEDGLVKTNYTLTIFRTINYDFTLKSLKLRSTSSKLNIEHTRPVNETVTEYLTDYTATVEYYKDYGSLQIELNVPSSLIDGTTAKSLNYGENVFTFRVHNEPDDADVTYTVTVTRIFNPDVGLANLWIEDEWNTGHPLTPTFDPMVLNYTANISNGSNVVRIHAQPSSATATVVGAGTRALNYGSNTYEVKVTNFDTSLSLYYTETYTIVVTRNQSSLACVEYLELYYNIPYGRNPLWSRYYPTTCSSEEYNITVRSGAQLHVYWYNHWRTATTVTTDGTWGGFEKGNTYVSHVYVTSQDGSTTNTYTFNITFPEWVGSKYLSDLKVDDGTGVNIYQLSPAFDREYPGPYTVVGTNVLTLNVPYEVSRVNLIATKEDYAAGISGDGWTSLNTGDNTRTIVVTSATTGETMTYTLLINREHGHDATLSDLYFKYDSPWDFIPTETFELTESDGVTPRPFDPSDTGPYYVVVSSYANPMSTTYAHATATDPNANVNVPTKVLTTGVYVPYNIEVTAEDGTTKIVYQTFIKKLMGTDSHGASLCVYNATEDKCENMYASPPEGDIKEGASFNPKRFDYYVEVNSTFGTQLNTTNVLFETIDYSATVTHMSSPLNLIRDVYVDYPIKVVSEDGLSEHTYTVHVKLVLSSDPRIKTVSITRGILLNIGSFEKGYQPEDIVNTNYYWIVDDVYYNAMTDAHFAYTMFHPRATSVKAYDADNKIITIVTTSEDGDYSLTYTFTIKKRSQVDVTAKKLKVIDPDYVSTKVPATYPSNYFTGEYAYDPELEDFVFHYTTHIYKTTTKLNIDFETNEPLATVSPDLTTTTFPITSDEQDIIFNVTSEDGSFTAPYKIHVIRDIETDVTIDDLKLIDEWNVCEVACNLRPTFDPDTRVYIVDIPAEYENMFFELQYKNDQQRAVFYRYDEEKEELVEIKNRTYDTSEGANDIIYEGYAFPLGLTQVQIVILDGLGFPTTSYTVMVYKGRSHEAKLDDLSVWSLGENPHEYTLDATFDPDKLVYGVSVPDGTTEVDIRYVTSQEGQTVTVQGATELATGINHATVTVLAEDEYTTITYDVYIDVGGAYRSWLASLTVSTGLKFHDLIPSFYKMETNYTVIVPSETSKVIVEGTPESSEVGVVGNNTYELETGNNKIRIKARYLNPSDPTEVLNETIYTVNIYRRYPNNVRLAYLDVREKIQPLQPEFDMGTTNYEVIVPSGTTKLTIVAYPEVENSSVSISGNHDLKTGYNIVSVAVISESGTLTKTYQLKVYVKPSNDARLSAIDVFRDSAETARYGVDKFDPEKHEYSITVPADVDSVYVVGTPVIANATVEGGGFNGLAYGNNVIQLKVTAEDESATSIYNVNVFRKYNLLLKELTHDLSYPLDPEFNPLVNEYTIEVPYDVKVIQFNAVAQAGSAVTLTYSSVNFLEIGENYITFVVSDPEGNTNVYTVNVLRVGDANNYLASLVPGQGMLTEEFYKTDQTYTLLLPNNLKTLDIDDWIIVPENEYATYKVEGYESINPESNDNKIKITVTAQNGAKRTYTLNVEFRDPAFFKHYLSALWVDNGNLSPKYDMDTVSYTVTMPYGTDETTIHAIPMLETDEVTIEGEVTQEKDVKLNFGRNVFKVKVDSGATGYKLYTLVIYRTSAPDPTLASMIVTSLDGSVHAYTPIFNKRIYAYYLTIPSSIKELKVNYLPSDPKSTVVVTGYKDFDKDAVNVITVEVTAPDGITKREYKIYVTLEADKDNYLVDLQVSGYELKPAFTMTNTGTYEVKVDNDVSKVLVYADASSSTSTVTINSVSDNHTGIDIVSGTVSLAPGNNYIQVAVTADSGDVRTYTVNVFKAFKTISTLKNIFTDFKDADTNISHSVDGYTPAFDEKQLTYTETVPYFDNATYTVMAWKKDSSSKAVYNSTTKLKEGINEIPITVTAEDGVTKTTYKIIVTMEKKPSSKLKELVIAEGKIDPDFDPETLTYYVEVPNEITSFDIYHKLSNPTGKGRAIPEDDDSTVTITGNSAFTENGISTVTITVNNPNADPATTTYKVEVYRGIAGDEKLSNLYIKDYPFTPSFAPLTLFYEREVESNVSKVTVGAFRGTSDATISINDTVVGGTGGEKEIDLDFGKNYVYVKVVASNGAKRTYTIEITRKDTANFLTELVSNTGDWTTTPTENLLKTKFDYELSLPNGVTEIKLKGNWSEGATVDNLDKIYQVVNVPPGSNLLYTITVTSASGETNTYTVTIHGAVSGETAIDLDTDKGKPSYLGNNKYELTVKDDASTIVLDVKPKDEGAKVTMQPFYALNYGETVITFTVTSSDGTDTQTYTLTVTRGKDIEKIIPSKDEIVLGVGEDETITYTIEPADATAKDVTFVSLDPTIASVDQDGKVTGLKQGVTKVEIRSDKDPEIKGIVSVYVLNKKIMSTTYNVVHKSETDNPLNLYDLDYVSGAQPKTKIDDFLDNFDNPATYLHVYSNGVEITDLSQYAGSCMTLKLEIAGKVWDEITIIVKSDIGTMDAPGDGINTASDVSIASSISSGVMSSSNIYKAIIDINNDGIISNADISTINTFNKGLIPTI